MIKITKKVKLHEVCNDMCNNFYYLCYGRIYNEDETKFKKFKFVIWYDIFDIQEYFEEDEDENNYPIIGKEEHDMYISELAYNFASSCKYDKFDRFIELCNETINNYNS